MTIFINEFPGQDTSTYAAEKIPLVSSFPKMLRGVHKRLKASIAFALHS